MEIDKTRTSENRWLAGWRPYALAGLVIGVLLVLLLAGVRFP